MVCIAPNVSVTGNITWNGPGGTICNSGILDANLRVPEQGIIYNNVGATLGGGLNFNGGNNSTAVVYNYGTWDSNDNLIMSGSATVYNYRGATAYFRDVNLNGGQTKFYNLGTLTSTSRLSLGGFFTNAASSTINAPAITINSGGQLDNLGMIMTTNYINNSLTNNCGTIRLAGRGSDFTNNGSGDVVNYGTINTDGIFSNNGDIQGSTTGGAGVVIVGGLSAQNGGATFGAIGRLDLCDAGAPAGGWDRNNGTVGSLVTYCQAPRVAAGCLNSPLPVELLDFSAKLIKGSVAISWSTASEKDNDKFVVERSADGELFEAVTEVAGHGTSSSAHTYSATDASPLPGTSYYRLQQRDLDGTASYSPVVSVLNTKAETAGKLGLHPNPATDYVVLDLRKAAGETCEVRIINLSGQLVRRLTLVGGQPQLDLRTLPAGTYLLQVQSPSLQTVQRLVKL
ncbi:MAG TPA: T9SS type A sorting domain-containing protein [Hymenobacter sp.]